VIRIFGLFDEMGIHRARLLSCERWRIPMSGGHALTIAGCTYILEYR
jgi:hypothetical protein